MDIFRLFRKCFYCGGKENLSHVISCGYYDTYRYYHPECLQRVLSSPENNEGYVDTAIEITDTLEAVERNRDLKMERARRALNTITPNKNNKVMNTPIIIMGRDYL